MISQEFFDSYAADHASEKPHYAALDLSDDHKEDLEFLLHLSGDYPGIEQWFIQKVISGESAGTRNIFRIKRDNRLVALGIAKQEAGEKKICTVRVHPSYCGRGLGVRVFDHLLSWLQTSRPVLTVSERNRPQFQRLFDHYGFVITSITPNRYREGVAELGYNELRSH
jgi:ribosomal protein S18 acetylase RimI-like enzyme